MYPENIRSFTRAVPFQPFRVTMTNGEEFDITHPDMIAAVEGMATIIRPGRSGERDAMIHVSLQQVLKIDPLTPQAAPPVNRSTA